MERGLINISQALGCVGIAAVSAYLYVHGAEAAASGWALLSLLIAFFGGGRTKD